MPVVAPADAQLGLFLFARGTPADFGCIYRKSIESGGRNRAELLAISELPEGAEREQRFAAFAEWEAFSSDLNKKDPRRFDTSQDAEPDEDEEEEDEGEATSS